MFGRMRNLCYMGYFFKHIFASFRGSKKYLQHPHHPEKQNKPFNINCLLLLKNILVVDGIWTLLKEHDCWKSLILDVCYTAPSKGFAEIKEFDPEIESGDYRRCDGNLILATIELITALESAEFPSSEYVDWPKKQHDAHRNLYEKLIQISIVESGFQLKNCDTKTTLAVFYFALQFDGDEGESQSLLMPFTQKIIGAYPSKY